MINTYRKRLQGVSLSNDFDKFIKIYMESREDSVDVEKEASHVLIGMGRTAVENISRMLCNKTINVEFRGALAHLLMITTKTWPEICKTDAVKAELINAVSDVDYFVAFNAAESLIYIGVEEISGIPTRKYVSKVYNNKLKNEFDKLIGR